MTRQIGYSIFTFEGGDWSRDDFEGLDKGFAAAKHSGFDYVEIPSYVLRTDLGGHRGSGDTSPRSDVEFLHRMGRVFDMSERHQVPLSAIFGAANLFREDTLQWEMDHLVVLARLASTAGIKVLPFTPIGPPVQGTKEATLIGKALSEVGRQTLSFGVRVAAHPHIDHPIENPDQIGAFCEASDPASVWLCLDTGHVLAGGGDPVKFAEMYGDRITYLHLKDLDSRAYAAAPKIGQEKYLAFRDPGQGDVDFRGVLRVLEGHGFDGPMVVENDMSPDPRGSMERAYTYLRSDLGL
jgi:sugar phosphate isomerase/epimerase